MPGQRSRLAYVTAIPMTQWWFLRHQNQYMSERGFELHTISSPGDFLVKLQERDQVAIHEVTISRRVTPLLDLVALVKLYVTMRQIKPDIVHLGTPKAALLGAIAAWLARVPVRLFLMHGSHTENARGLTRMLVWSLERLTVCLCHQTICVSPSLLRFLRAARILDADQGIVIANGMANGVDVTRFDANIPRNFSGFPPQLAATLADRDIDVIGYIGRIARDKGIDELVQAWQHVRSMFPNSILILVGPTKDEPPISSRSRLLLAADPRAYTVSYTDDVVPYYRVMSLFVYPSYGTEGLPTAPMEAAAMGLPVIVTNVIGCTDAVQDGVTGKIVPARDADSLATAIKTYLADPQLRRKHGEAGRERVVRDFLPEPIWEGLYREYLRLLRANGLPVPES